MLMLNDTADEGYQFLDGCDIIDGIMRFQKTTLKNQDTYVYIDASNIRWACIKTLGFHIDFMKLLNYFRTKYPNLKEVRYYEGIAKGDKKKQKFFEQLSEAGYTICKLERKLYNSIETDKREIKCPRCGNKWITQIEKKRLAMKSNVDVYLASNMVTRASSIIHPTHIILVSCDGDYAEAIKDVCNLNKNISISVLATPQVKDTKKNTLSIRLKNLVGELQKPKFMLQDISEIRHLIENDQKTPKKERSLL